MPARHKKTTLADKILAALKAGQSLTQGEAFQAYGCKHLGARIYQLRTAGHDIRSRVVPVGDNKTASEYFLPLEALPAPILEAAQ